LNGALHTFWFQLAPRLVGSVFNLPNYWLRDGTRQLATSNGDAYRARNNTPRDFLVGLAFLCCVFTCDATTGGIAHLADGFSLRFVHFGAELLRMDDEH
jgi:hypothetical protein